MKKTTNYQLNQWAKTDRIMMDDFNADNAIIDAALARVERRSAFHTILDETTTEDCTRYDRRLNIDWSEWKTVYIDVVLAPGSASDLLICYHPTFFDKIVTADCTWNHLVAFPCGNPEMPLYLMAFQGSSGSLICVPQVFYKNFNSIYIESRTATSIMKAGSRIRVLGERM